MKESDKRTKKTNRKSKALMTALFFLFLTIVFTVIVKHVNVGQIGPEGSSVGLSSINGSVHELFGGFNKFWYDLTEKTGLLLALPVVAFALAGLTELIKRKSLKKVDCELKVLAMFYAVVAMVYVFFEKVFVINYRPVLIDGELEASYPSSHTLFAFCFCCSAIYVINRLVRAKNKFYATMFNVLLTMILFLNVIGRLLSGAHWFTDIFGGILISAMLVSFFKYSLDFCDNKDKKSIKEEHKKIETTKS
jgi:undecaprenyl-diphosphatase